MTGKFELFKTSQHFDSTVNNPAWLGWWAALRAQSERLTVLPVSFRTQAS